MTKRELCAAVAARTGMTQKDATKALDAMAAVVGESLQLGDKVTFLNFGTFDYKRRSEYMARIPGTNQWVRVPARRYATFRPGKGLRRAVCPTCVK